MRTREPRRVAAFGAVLIACGVSVVACASAADPDPAGTTTASLSTTSEACDDAGAGSDGGVTAPGSYFSCAGADECVAVPMVENCCNNGWLVAVSRLNEVSYVESTACTKVPQPLCPEYLVHDTRVAECNLTMHLCVMVQPSPSPPPAPPPPAPLE